MPRPAAAALFVLAIQLAAGVATAAPLQAPTYVVGDVWLTTSISNGERIAETETQVEGFERIDVDGTVYDTVRFYTVSIQRTSSLGNSTTQTRLWYDNATGGLVRSAMNVTPFGATRPTSAAVTVYDAPCIEHEWPLDVGKSWTSTCSWATIAHRAGTEDRRPGNRTTSYQALRTEDVVAGGRTWSALYIESVTTRRAESHDWFAPAACRIVKSERGDEAAPLVVELQQVRCRATGVDTAPAAPQRTPAATALVALVALAGAALVARRRP